MEALRTMEPVSVSSKQSVSSIISSIEKSGLPMIVTQNKQYMGVLDLRTIQEHPNLDFTKTKVGTIADKAPRLVVGDSIDDVVKLFHSCRYKALPVVDKNNKVVGMISLYNVLSTIINSDLLPSKKVVEIMSSPVITTKVDSTIAQTLTLMRTKGLRRVVVVDNKDLLKGVISVRDISSIAKIPKERNPILSPQKYSFMIAPIESMVNTRVKTIAPSITIDQVAKKMIAQDLSSMVVVEKSKPIGIVTLRDILNTYLNAKEVHKITISGLTGDDREYLDEVYDLADGCFSKLSQRFGITGLTLHIKKHGNRYSVHAKAIFSNTIVNVHNFAWDLTEAVHVTLEELKTAILRMKPESKRKIKGSKKPNSKRKGSK